MTCSTSETCRSGIASERSLFRHHATAFLDKASSAPIEALRLDISTVLTEISIAAFDGTRWLTVDRFRFVQAPDPGAIT
jgi:hypothetical protein